MEQVSLELRQVEKLIQGCPESDFDDMRRADPFRCFPLRDQQCVNETFQTNSVKIDQSCQTDGKGDASAIGSSVQLTTRIEPTEASSGWGFFDDEMVDNDGSSSDNEGDEEEEEEKIIDIPTSYTVDRMACDGNDIMYTSYDDVQPDLIAYCLLDDENSEADSYRHWRLSRIEDMIWWEAIKRFVCATQNGICTVDYFNKKFKILSVLRGKWSRIRVAANSNHIFVHSGPSHADGEQADEIQVYSTDFQLNRTFDIAGHRQLSPAKSFCVTDQTLASIRIIALPPNRGGRALITKVVMVNFFDLSMQHIRSITLGKCSDAVEIRTDGDGHFFVATGLTKLHVVTLDGKYETIDLDIEYQCLAVTSPGEVAASKARRSIDLISY